MVSFVYGFWAIVMLLFTCETGQRLTYEFIQFDNEISQLDWNFLPIDIQRLLPIIMANTQQPFQILCFGSTTCGRETFKSVSLRKSKWKIWMTLHKSKYILQVANSGYTFFMMLRKFYGWSMAMLKCSHNTIRVYIQIYIFPAIVLRFVVVNLATGVLRIGSCLVQFFTAVY